MGGKGLGSAMLMVAALIWGTALVAQRLGMEHCGPLAFNAARFGLGGIVTGLALLLRVVHGRAYFACGTFSAAGGRRGIVLPAICGLLADFRGHCGGAGAGRRAFRLSAGKR